MLFDFSKQCTDTMLEGLSNLKIKSGFYSSALVLNQNYYSEAEA